MPRGQAEAWVGIWDAHRPPRKWCPTGSYHGVDQGPEPSSAPSISYPLSGNFLLPGRARRAGVRLHHPPDPPFPSVSPLPCPELQVPADCAPAAPAAMATDPLPGSFLSPPQQPTAPAETGADASASLMPRPTFHFCPLSPPQLWRQQLSPHSPPLHVSVYCPPHPHTHTNTLVTKGLPFFRPILSECVSSSLTVSWSLGVSLPCLSPAPRGVLSSLGLALSVSGSFSISSPPCVSCSLSLSFVSASSSLALALPLVSLPYPSDSFPVSHPFPPQLFPLRSVLFLLPPRSSRLFLSLLLCLGFSFPLPLLPGSLPLNTCISFEFSSSISYLVVSPMPSPCPARGELGGGAFQSHPKGVPSQVGARCPGTHWAGVIESQMGRRGSEVEEPVGNGAQEPRAAAHLSRLSEDGLHRLGLLSVTLGRGWFQGLSWPKKPPSYKDSKEEHVEASLIPGICLLPYYSDGYLRFCLSFPQWHRVPLLCLRVL